MIKLNLTSHTKLLVRDYLVRSYWLPIYVYLSKIYADLFNRKFSAVFL